MRQVALFMLGLLDLFWQTLACAVLVKLFDVKQSEFTAGEVDLLARIIHDSSSRNR